jgi:hypothetical protein
MIDMDDKHVLIQVKVEAFARNKAIQVTETCDDFPVLVRVTATTSGEMPPPWAGLDVVVALNVRMNEVQEPIIMLVDRLSSHDRLSILFQGPNASQELIMELTYMSNHGRDVARLKISELAKSHVNQRVVYRGPILQKAAQVHFLEALFGSIKE